MVVGAGLMFVLMHGEVSAESELNKKLKAVVGPKKPEPFVCSKGKIGENYYISHCETKTMDCAVLLTLSPQTRTTLRLNVTTLTADGLSCVKKGLFR